MFFTPMMEEKTLFVMFYVNTYIQSGDSIDTQLLNAYVVGYTSSCV